MVGEVGAELEFFLGDYFAEEGYIGEREWSLAVVRWRGEGVAGFADGAPGGVMGGTEAVGFIAVAGGVEVDFGQGRPVVAKAEFEVVVVEFCVELMIKTSKKDFLLFLKSIYAIYLLLNSLN